MKAYPYACAGILFAFIISCNPSVNSTSVKYSPVMGTWKLLNGTLIEKGDSAVTDYTQGKSFIKMINQDHFAFLLHDLAKGLDSNKVFSSGGGRYELKGDDYTEHLEYCSDRQWEGNDFSFKVAIRGDTLIQRGVEKIDSLKIDRINIEKYIRLK